MKNLRLWNCDILHKVFKRLFDLHWNVKHSELLYLVIEILPNLIIITSLGLVLLLEIKQTNNRIRAWMIRTHTTPTTALKLRHGLVIAQNNAHDSLSVP